MPNEKVSITPADALKRRDFLKVGSMALLGLGAAELPGVVRADTAPPPAPPTGSKLKATIGEPIGYKNLHGDSWTPTWADDDNLYSIADDTLGTPAQPISANLAVYKITGNIPDIHVEVVNAMPEFGKLGDTKPEDLACWKASGLTCIDGVLYLAASRNRYMKPGGGFNIQQVFDSIIIKSSDHGKTWSTPPPLGQAMFPGHTFGNPAFVQYGKDGKGTKDGSDKYIYAVSNDGTWNNGNTMTVGRVPRDKIANLDAKDWEFIHGFEDDSKGQPTYNPVWRPRHDYALYTFRSPGRTGVGGVHYLAGIDRYITPQWHYPSLNEIPQRVAWNHSRFDLWEGPTPWGPWTLFHTQDFETQGYYNPTIPSKFISDDGKKFWIFAAGDFTTSDHPYYTINMIPVTLEVSA
jgi:hypothetical protein